MPCCAAASKTTPRTSASRNAVFMLSAVNTDSTATPCGRNSSINSASMAWISRRRSGKCSGPLRVARRAPKRSMRQRRPSLSITPYPVAPAAAGSTPRTRIKLSFVRGESGTAMSVRRRAAGGHNFFGGCGAGFSLWGLVLARPKPRRLKPALLNLLRGHYGLHFFFVDVEVGGNFLNVVVLFERFDEPQHLRRLDAGKLHVILRKPADLGGIRSDSVLDQRTTNRLALFRRSQYLPGLAIVAQI